MSTSKRAARITVKATIDRLDDTVAVLDADGFALSLKRAWLPPDAHEGDGIELTIVRHAGRDLEGSVRQRLDALTKKRPR